MAELLTVSEAARRVHVTSATVYAWIRKGKLKPVRMPSGRVRIPEDQLTEPTQEATGAA